MHFGVLWFGFCHEGEDALCGSGAETLADILGNVVSSDPPSQSPHIFSGKKQCDLTFWYSVKRYTVYSVRQRIQNSDQCHVIAWLILPPILCKSIIIGIRN